MQVPSTSLSSVAKGDGCQYDCYYAEGSHSHHQQGTHSDVLLGGWEGGRGRGEEAEGKGRRMMMLVNNAPSRKMSQ